MMRRFLFGFCLLFSFIAAFLVYQRGLSGPFLFDDGPNIVHNANLAILEIDQDNLKRAALSGFSGPLMRPLSMMSFAANYYATGLDPYYFKLTNLVIHLFNGLGIVVLTSLVLNFYRKRFETSLSVAYVPWISLAAGAAWLLHPFNLTTVLYVVQRMTSLSAFFVIWGLVVFMWGRTRLCEGKSGIALILASLLLFMPLAAFSKENGVLLPLFMLVAEITLFAFHAEQPWARRFLVGLYAFSVAVPAAIALGYLAMHADWVLAGYRIRDFSLAERLMTEGRVMWFYIWQILLPSNAQMGLYHDDIAISRGLFQPASTVFSILGLAALFVLSLWARKKAPLFAFGVLFFLAGHILESTVLPLEIAHEHRNYLPMYGILLALFYYLLYPLKYASNLRLRQYAAALLIGLFAFNTFARAEKWSSLPVLFQAEVTHHPNSALANGELGAVYSGIVDPDPVAAEANYISARMHFEAAAVLDKSDTKSLFGLLMLNSSRNRAAELGWLQELERRLEAAPYASITSDKLIGLTECQLQGQCRLAAGELNGLLQAALRNPTLNGVNRAKVLYALSSYLINVERDYPSALEVMRQMVQAAPQEAAFRFALANFLVALRHFDEAKEQLLILKRQDPFRSHSAEITLLEQSLPGQSGNEAHH